MAGEQKEEEKRGITLDEILASLSFFKEKFVRYKEASAALAALSSNLRTPGQPDVEKAFSLICREIEEYESSVCRIMRIADKIDDLQAMVYAADNAGVAMAVIQTTEKGRNVHPLVTNGYALLTGYTSEELESVPVAKIVHQEDFAKFNEHYRMKREDPSVSPLCEVRIISRGRGTVYVDASLGKGKYRGKPAYVAFLWDVSLRKELEKKAELASKFDFLKDSLRGVLHDLGNIAQNFEAARRYTPEELIRRGMWEGIVASMDRAEDLAEKINDFCSGKYTETAQHIDIAPVVREAIGLVSESYSKRGITLSSEVEKGNYVFVPPVDFSRVLVNILVNAGDAIEDAEKKNLPEWDRRKEVAVTEQKVADRVRISISDTGIGLEDTSKIYLPNFSTKKGRHSGLGLGIAYTVLAQNNGDINHYSAGKGKGATFYITLPYRPVSKPANQ
jgi:PAS domain S-box-containing protein